MAKLMDYRDRYGFIYYKTDIQTELGTVKTGARNNTTYRVPVPKS